MDLKTMLQQGRGQLVEFMMHPEVDRLAETLVAFANADGGTILVGIGSSGRIAGDLDPEGLEATLLRAQMRCRPPVRTEWQTVHVPHGTVVAVTVPRSSDLHTLDNGQILLRSGDHNRSLEGDELRRFAVAKGGTSFEEEAVAGVTMEDLSQEVIAEYERKRHQRAPRGERLSREELLHTSGAFTQTDEVTVAGLLLFGRQPQLFLPQSGIVFVRFPGTRPGTLEGPGYARREEINGPLSRIIEQAWEVLWEEMRREAVITGLNREERPEYPEVAVREALVNAVVHRDYRLRGRRIEIRMFDDRLEIISPGGLPGHITLDNIVEEHFSRNPRIVRGLFYWGYIEELGIGVDRMIEAMVQGGHPPPHFDAKPHSFTVVLRNVRERPVQKWPQSMNERQIHALKYIEERGQITNREYRTLFPDISAETVRLDLADMVSKGLLLKIGDKKGTFYILK